MIVKRGMRVSLNKNNRSYFFQGDNGINLRAGIEDTAKIPEDIQDYFLEMIEKAVMSGGLVIGWTKEVELEAPRDIKGDKDLLNMGVKKMMPYIDKIAQTAGKGERSPLSRLEALLSAEEKDKNRKTIIDKIEELLDGMAGVTSVEEDEKEEIKIQLS